VAGWVERKTDRQAEKQTAFSQGPLAPYTQKHLHTDAFTQSSFYTQKFLVHREAFTQQLLHSLYTEQLLHKAALHTDAFTQGSLYTEQLLHTNAFTHRRFSTQKLLHREAFTQSSFYTQKYFSFYTEAFYT